MSTPPFPSQSVPTPTSPLSASPSPPATRPRLRRPSPASPRAAAARALKRSRLAEEEASTVRVDGAWSRTPNGPWDHPDWVLTRAVAAAVINPEEHQLIADTRLDDVPLPVVAARLGISSVLAAAWRRKAEDRLVAAIASGELDWETLHTCSAAVKAKRLKAQRA